MPQVVSVRETLTIAAEDGALALTNAMLATALQTCVRDLIQQRTGDQ